MTIKPTLGPREYKWLVKVVLYEFNFESSNDELLTSTNMVVLAMFCLLTFVSLFLINVFVLSKNKKKYIKKK